MVPETIELRVWFGRGFRWPLRDSDRLEVWTADHYCLGEISGALVRQWVMQSLGEMVLRRRFEVQMRTSNAKLAAVIRKPLTHAPDPRVLMEPGLVAVGVPPPLPAKRHT